MRDFLIIYFLSWHNTSTSLSSSKKVKAGTITASRLYQDRLFLPYSYVHLLCYCSFNCGNYILRKMLYAKLFADFLKKKKSLWLKDSYTN